MVFPSYPDPKVLDSLAYDEAQASFSVISSRVCTHQALSQASGPLSAINCLSC